VEPGVVVVEVDCSSGTYVRTLAADLGHALGGGAHLRNLRRTAVGSFDLASAGPLDELSPDDVRPPADAVAHLDQVVVDDEVAAMVATGRRLARTGHAVTFAGEGPWAVRGAAEGSLLAVYEPRGDMAKPAVVVVQPPPAGDG
jgi:tRNA pseudouridine55 synthase